jgi:hypothetical protein
LLWYYIEVRDDDWEDRIMNVIDKSKIGADRILKSEMGKENPVGVKVHASITIIVMDNEENTRAKILNNRPALLKINIMIPSILLPKSELVRFSLTIRTIHSRTCTVYIVFDFRRIKYGCVDICFAQITRYYSKILHII